MRQDLHVDNHWCVCAGTGLDGPLQWQVALPGEMRRLDAYDDIGVLLDFLRGLIRVHVGDVVLRPSPDHAFTDDIDEREHTRLGAIDYRLLELIECTPARAPAIGNRGYALGEMRVVWPDPPLVPEDVGVNIDQPRRDVITRYIDRLFCLLGRDVLGDAGDGSAFDRHIHHAIDLIGRIDHMPAFEEDVKRLGEGGRNEEEREEKDGDSPLRAAGGWWNRPDSAGRARYSPHFFGAERHGP